MQNLKYKIENLNRGFTLIEVLVVVAVFGVVGTIITATIVNTLRTTTKSNIVSLVRQNGDYAVSQMSRTIRTAVSLQTPLPPCGSSSSPTSTQSVAVVALDGTTSAYVCTGSSGNPANTITMNGNPLLDTSKVSTTSCTFSCSQETPSDIPIITIDFSLDNTNASTLVEQAVNPIQFRTSVEMRNIKR